MTDAPITGGCLCGAVRFSARFPIVRRRQCWCRDCQYLACGSASTNIIIERRSLAISGRLAEYRSLADSGNHMVRRFCPSCGTHVLAEAEENPDYIVIRVGVLDDPSIGAPEALIWTASAPGWAKHDAALEAVPGQPPSPRPPA